MSKKFLPILTFALLLATGDKPSNAMCTCNCYVGSNPPPAYTFYHWYSSDRSCSTDCYSMGYENSCCDWGYGSYTCPTSAVESKGQSEKSKGRITRFDSKDHAKKPGIQSKSKKEPKVQGNPQKKPEAQTK